MNGVASVVESSCGTFAFLDRDRVRPRLVRVDGFETIGRVERTTFAFLAVAFGRRRILVSESRGPVRCLDLDSGALELCRLDPPAGSHYLDLAFDAARNSFAGISWSYADGGSPKLVVFDPEGAIERMQDLGPAPDMCFCRDGAALLTSDGRLVDVASGDERRLDGFTEKGD